MTTVGGPNIRVHRPAVSHLRQAPELSHLPLPLLLDKCRIHHFVNLLSKQILFSVH